MEAQSFLGHCRSCCLLSVSTLVPTDYSLVANLSAGVSCVSENLLGRTLLNPSGDRAMSDAWGSQIPSCSLVRVCNPSREMREISIHLCRMRRA